MGACVIVCCNSSIKGGSDDCVDSLCLKFAIQSPYSSVDMSILTGQGCHVEILHACFHGESMKL